MKQLIPIIARSAAVLTGAILLTTSLPASAAVISVNYIQASGHAITNNYGLAGQDSVAGGWLNLLNVVNSTALPFSDGTPSPVNLTGNQPGGFGNGNAAYAGTPLISGNAVYPATPTNFATLTNLNAAFPNGYKVIVYLSGFLANRGASISDGLTTNFFRPATNAVEITNSLTAGLFQTTQTTDLGSGNNPLAQYAVFGSPVLLTNNSLTLTLRHLYASGGAYLGGFQIVGASATDLAARIWRGNVNNNWDTTTANWTNIFYGVTNYADGDPVFFTDVAVADSPAVNLTAARSPGSVTVDSTKNYTFTGSGITGATGLTKRGSGSLTLANPNTYAGNTVINVGTLRLGASGVLPDGAGAGGVSIAAGATLDLNGNNEGINGLSGAGTVDNTGGAASLTVGLNDVGGTFPGTLQGAAGLTKQGTNILTLTGSSTHSGPTIVAQGGLVLRPLSAFSGSSALVVSNGANLELVFTNGSGLFSTANVSLHGGAALTVDYGNAAVTGFGTPLTTVGALNLNGVSQIGIRGVNFNVGTYTIISYATKTGAGSISPTPAFLPSGMVATIQDTGSAINLVVTTPSVQSLLWTQGDGEWSTNGLFNWNLGTAEYKEYPGGFGDIVAFDNSNFGTVTLPHDVKPFAVTLAGNYTLTGPGRITGNVGLNRSGFAATTFILDNTNTYTGLTVISNGMLQVNRPGALGATNNGTLVISGASLALGNGVTLANEPITINGNGAGTTNGGALRTVDIVNPITVAAPIILGSNARLRAADGGELIITGPITDNGSNYTVFLHAGQTNTLVRLNSAGNVAGNLTVYGVNPTRGIIRLGVNNVFPTALLSVGGGLHDLNGTTQTFAGLAAGFDPNLGMVTNSSGTPATLTLNYANTNATASFQSVLAGPVSVVKDGAGVQSFAGGTAIKHTYTGTTTINDGIFGVSSDFSGVTNSFIVNSGGTLRGSNSIGGPLTVNAGGMFYAGFASNQVSVFNISNDVVLAGNTIVALNKDAAVSNDVINVTGTLQYGGTLTVFHLGTNALAVGDSFTIFPPVGGARSGSFTILSDPGVTFNFTPASGVLTVASVVGPTPPTLNYTNLGGGVAQFSWAGAFKLQWQTNSAATGLSTNWVDYPDPSNPVNVTNNPAIRTTFFRLSSL